MTVLDPSTYDPSPLLLMDTVDFPEVLAVPERRAVDGGDLLIFRFANGYGAAVTRREGHALLHAFEFCVLDCTLSVPRLTFGTAIAPEILTDLAREQVTHLLAQAERLPPHPRLYQADEWLSAQAF